MLRKRQPKPKVEQTYEEFDKARQEKQRQSKYCRNDTSLHQLRMECAVNLYGSKLMEYPGVISVGVGKHAIIVYRQPGYPNSDIPEELDGVRVIVKMTKPPKPLT